MKLTPLSSLTGLTRLELDWYCEKSAVPDDVDFGPLAALVQLAELVVAPEEEVEVGENETDEEDQQLVNGMDDADLAVAGMQGTAARGIARVVHATRPLHLVAAAQPALAAAHAAAATAAAAAAAATAMTSQRPKSHEKQQPWQHQGLVRVSVPCANAAGVVVRALAAHTRLTDVELSECGRVGLATLLPLARLQQLQRLALWHVPSIAGGSLGPLLAQLPLLHTLQMEYWAGGALAAADLPASLAPCTALRRLLLWDSCLEGVDLPALPGLTSLDLSSSWGLAEAVHRGLLARPIAVFKPSDDYYEDYYTEEELEACAVARCEGLGITGQCSGASRTAPMRHFTQNSGTAHAGAARGRGDWRGGGRDERGVAATTVAG